MTQENNELPFSSKPISDEPVNKPGKTITIPHISKNSLVVAGFIIITLFLTIASLSGMSGQKLTPEEIEKNSARYQELQTQISQYEVQISNIQAVIDSAKSEQQTLHRRNSLLRELFTAGENQTQSPSMQAQLPVALN